MNTRVWLLDLWSSCNNLLVCLSVIGSEVVTSGSRTSEAIFPNKNFSKRQFSGKKIYRKHRIMLKYLITMKLNWPIKKSYSKNFSLRVFLYTLMARLAFRPGFIGLDFAPFSLWHCLKLRRETTDSEYPRWHQQPGCSSVFRFRYWVEIVTFTSSRFGAWSEPIKLGLRKRWPPSRAAADYLCTFI